MDDELRAAYGRLDEALTPPGDAVSLVARRVAVRRRRRTATAVVASAAAVAVIAGTAWAIQGDETTRRPGPATESDLVAPTDVATPTDPPVVSDLRKPTVEEKNLDCTGPHQLAVVQNPADYQGGEYGPDTVAPWLLPGADYALYRIDQDQIVARLTTEQDEVYAELGLVAIDDKWRLESIAACSSAFPGLDAVIRDSSPDPAAGQIVAVATGASPATIDTLGQTWVLGSECSDLPEGLLGVGQAVSSGDRLSFTDLSGGTLTFLPAASGSASCEPDPPSGITAQLDVDCEGAGWRVGMLANPEIPSNRYRQAREATYPWMLLSGSYELKRSDDPDRLVANLFAQPGGRLYASLGMSRADGWWRIDSVSACTDVYPGLEAAEVFGSGLPLVELVAVNEGHCWIDTLEYGGQAWDLPDEDQFGWGGLGPEEFLGIGSIRQPQDNRLDYVDLAGARLTFVPADSPGTDANQGICK